MYKSWNVGTSSTQVCTESEFELTSMFCDKAVCTDLAGKNIESLSAWVKELEETVIDLKILKKKTTLFEVSS